MLALAAPGFSRQSLSLSLVVSYVHGLGKRERELLIAPGARYSSGISLTNERPPGLEEQALRKTTEPVRLSAPQPLSNHAKELESSLSYLLAEPSQRRRHRWLRESKSLELLEAQRAFGNPSFFVRNDTLRFDIHHYKHRVPYHRH